MGPRRRPPPALAGPVAMPRAVHPKVRPQLEARIEADEQVLAVGVDAGDGGPDQPVRPAGPGAAPAPPSPPGRRDAAAARPRSGRACRPQARDPAARASSPAAADASRVEPQPEPASPRCARCTGAGAAQDDAPVPGREPGLEQPVAPRRLRRPAGRRPGRSRAPSDAAVGDERRRAPRARAAATFGIVRRREGLERRAAALERRAPRPRRPGRRRRPRRAGTAGDRRRRGAATAAPRRTGSRDRWRPAGARPAPAALGVAHGPQAVDRARQRELRGAQALHEVAAPDPARFLHGAQHRVDAPRSRPCTPSAATASRVSTPWRSSSASASAWSVRRAVGRAAPATRRRRPATSDQRPAASGGPSDGQPRRPAPGIAGRAGASGARAAARTCRW